MKLFFHYCSYGFSNCYILGEENNDPQKQNAAVIIDPGSMDNVILESIENNNFELKAILITHDHLGHVNGIRTLQRIYKAEIFAVNQTIVEHNTTMVKDGDVINISGFKFEVISIPGHSSDSVVYRTCSAASSTGGMLFTGDVLTAGLVGSTASAYGAATQMNNLRSRLLSLPGDYIVLPGHGPPSTLEAERRFNTDIFHYDLNRSKRPVFRLDI
jgi:glyoxylase-like metal-dependent hydrolase (beta-lactamase superfamily II)